ncbi:hypothetical protein RHMOL_Rhmol05G0009800 [Rhododendron molle]|uniref:Uncharacterized protein n=1 Tax=Rhododendron molle TaxID=49168 RepID=A0ACC0NK09_RHOML|nr:hypothetical protein RHMOL_Rhmol05G0009800 [Rhododendron molle]
MEEKYKWWRYIPLLKATLRGDWKTAENFFEQDKSALTAPIVGETLDTTLHIAVGSRRGEEDIHFVEKLVDLMPVEALATKNSSGYTPLHIAAWVGNTKAAKILVDKHPPLLYTISGFYDLLPIHLAALHARRDTLSYLLDVTDDDVTDDQVFNGQSGAAFINCLISSDFFDIALKWVERYPRLAILQHKRSHSPLEFITWKLSAFPSERSRNCFRRGSHLGFWLRKIYPRDTVSQNLHAILWKVFEFSGKAREESN